MTDLLTAPEAARELGLTRSRLHQLLTAGRIQGTRFGQGNRAPWMISRDALEAYKQMRAGELNAALARLGKGVTK